MEVGEDLSRFRFVIGDRDAKFSAGFDADSTADGLKVLRASRAYAHAERSVGTVRRELLDRMLISNAGSCDRCWPRTPMITTATVGTAPWGRRRRSGRASQRSSCRLEGHTTRSAQCADR
jgi:hypothetical protein